MQFKKNIKSYTLPSTLERLKKRTLGYKSKLSCYVRSRVREITVAYAEGVQEEVPAAEFKMKGVGQSPPPQKGGPLSRCQIPTNTSIRGVYSILQSDDPKLDNQHENCKSDAQVQLKKDRPYECEHVLNRLFHQSQEQNGKRWDIELERCDNSFKLNKTERLVYGANRCFKEQQRDEKGQTEV